MAVTRDQRRAILHAAKRWLGTPYDTTHEGRAWKDRSVVPPAFDCSTFVCRVALEALGIEPGMLVADAAWLIDNLVEVPAPEPGDIVGYGRVALATERRAGYDAVFHVMLYAGNGQVIGACDVKGAVTVRPIDYTPVDARRRWRFVGTPPAPFRRLELRSG